MTLKLCSFATVLSLLLAACQPKTSTPPAPPPPEVTALSIRAESVTLTRELPGRATPSLVAEVRPQVTGLIQRRLFTEGGLVEAGQPLYQIDDASYRADFNRAKASLARSQASVELARLNATRSAGLAQVDAISREEDENAIAALAQAEADLGVAQAALAGAEVVLGYTTIRSPIKGRIGRSSVTQGALVTANQVSPLATVQQLDPIYVDVSQSSRELLDLRKDLAAGTLHREKEMPVTILLEEGTRYPHSGKLAFAEVTVDPTTGSFAARVLVPNPDEILLPGMYVRAIVMTGIRDAGILLPQQAVARDPRGNTSVMLVGPDGKVEARGIQVSRTVGDKWLVESGVAVGDRVIVEGLQKVRAGAMVKVTGPAPARPSPGPTAALPNNDQAAK